jgi:hypothetical protein
MEVCKLIFLKSFLALNLLTTYQCVGNQTVNTPKIINVDTGYPTDDNWVHIPRGTKKITFKVKAHNTESVLYWLMPTGTQTWYLRKLIGYDIRKNDKENEFSFTWNIDRSSLLDHLHIQALGEGIDSEIVNLYMD